MKFSKYLFLFLIVLVLAAPVFSKTVKTAPKKSVHPVPMEDGNCLSCHEGSKQYEQWQSSAHGLILVKCEVCHGEEKAFQKTPSDKVCRGCHADQAATMPAGKTCVTCHPAHTFNVHKSVNYNK
ncbi:hypothetical protein [Calditerrivibrio nitroreducens]|uniref:Uncharacterized protein n=1 Tax=Calditerrivibrio nitroreducens (strain DSM 19672 / NBRC 101217 / Yu37-1) TaxID=768670 RepID=E4TGR2_CALNY|nr:hypothetical protein [Calditerrivibrio nitroreducens]ADR19775.1 hypothetical protein Calni_1871 [Calditerrivibrio nitroreducens DSM 19672]